jgi:hypothetical protein
VPTLLAVDGACGETARLAGPLEGAPTPDAARSLVDAFVAGRG